MHTWLDKEAGWSTREQIFLPATAAEFIFHASCISVELQGILSGEGSCFHCTGKYSTVVSLHFCCYAVG